MVRSLSWREGIIWIGLMVASCQPHGLAGQEERELTHDFPKASAAGSSIMVMGQEPCIAEAFLPFVQYEGCEGKQLAQQPLLGKPLLQASFPPASTAAGGDHGWEAGAGVRTVF